MPLQCVYCGVVFWNAQDETSHAKPCRPGVAPGSTTIGVPPGETQAPEAVPEPANLLAADTAAVGLVEGGADS